RARRGRQTNNSPSFRYELRHEIAKSRHVLSQKCRIIQETQIIDVALRPTILGFYQRLRHDAPRLRVREQIGMNTWPAVPRVVEIFGVRTPNPAIDQNVL